MPVYDYDKGEINIKIVYYGPGLSGKTTNLEHIYSKLPRDTKGKMVSMKTRADRTLFFDFLPISIGSINDMRVRFLLYTVPGQVYYNATRKLVLKGVDAVVFVVDSQSSSMNENKESLKNLEENLNDLSMTLDEIPWVVQFNKRDLTDIVDSDEMRKILGLENIPVFEGIATEGKGVYETFKGIANIVFERISDELNRTASESRKVGRKGEEKDSVKVDAEVVAKGSSSTDNSEAGEGESLNKAEDREEEHKSVSEFVDDILKENKGNELMNDLGATRGGYEEYGHLVNLSDEEAESEGEKAVSEGENEKTDASGQDMQLISDPLEKLSGREEAPTSTQVQPKNDKSSGIEKRSDTITVPVKISREKLEEDGPLRVVLDIKIVS